jgi:hypothetical protein
LFLVRGSLDERLSQRFGRELAHGRADIERLDSLGPERLVSEERLDDGGLRISSASMPSVDTYNTSSQRRAG